MQTALTVTVRAVSSRSGGTGRTTALPVGVGPFLHVAASCIGIRTPLSGSFPDLPPLRIGICADLDRLHGQPIVVALTLDGGARIEVATSVDGRDGVVVPFAAPSARRRG